MFLSTKNIIMNKVISHIHYIYIASPLLKKKLGYNLFTINLCFNSSPYYPTLDKILAMKLSLHLICFIIRLYSCNINPHLVFSVIFILHVPNKCDGIVILHLRLDEMYIIIASKIKIRQVIFFFNFGLFFSDLCQCFKKQIAIRQIYVIFTFLEQNCSNTYTSNIHC